MTHEYIANNGNIVSKLKIEIYLARMKVVAWEKVLKIVMLSIYSSHIY